MCSTCVWFAMLCVVYSLEVVDVVFSHNGGAALTSNHPDPIVGNNSVPIALSMGKTSAFE